jgi:hypothetical protein
MGDDIGPAPWTGSFDVDGVDGGPIDLQQVSRKHFLLRSTITYTGERTGLEGKLPDEVISVLRTVTPDQIGGPTDLTSVPRALQWFVSTYGAHTPAALVHDRMIGIDPPVEGLTDVDADRYFRFMLEDLGVRWVRRWLMWVAVALRTRFQTGWWHRIGVIVWVVASLVGLSVGVWSLATAHWGALAIASVAPVVFAGLWGGQYVAGLLGAYAAVWILPPTVIGALGYVAYAGIELVAGVVGRLRNRPGQPGPSGAPVEPEKEPISYTAF